MRSGLSNLDAPLMANNALASALPEYGRKTTTNVVHAHTLPAKLPASLKDSVRGVVVALGRQDEPCIAAFEPQEARMQNDL